MKDYDPTNLTVQSEREFDKQEREHRKTTQEADDLTWLMSHKAGRRIVWGLLDRAGVFRSSFSPNALQMAFAEGSRNEGLRLLTHIQAVCPDKYHVMIEEKTNV